MTDAFVHPRQERANWLKRPIAKDAFGAALIASGIKEKRVQEWLVDARVTHEDGEGSVFDLLEDLDVEECLAKCLTIKK